MPTEIIVTVGPNDPTGLGLLSRSGGYWFMVEGPNGLKPLFGEDAQGRRVIPHFATEAEAHQWLTR